MSVTGRVVNGVVGVDAGGGAAGGAEVKVEAVPVVPRAMILLGRRWGRCWSDGADGKDDIGSDLPDDLAANHDYYVHGHTRKPQPRAARWIHANGEVELTGQEAAYEANPLHESWPRRRADCRLIWRRNHDPLFAWLPKQ